MICPCCQSRIASAPTPESLSNVRFGTQGYQLILALIDAYPRAVTLDRLVAEVYGRREPDWAEDNVRSLVSYTRRKIAPHGWTISASRGRTAGTYKLEKVG